MELLDTLHIYRGNEKKVIELFQGDLTEVTADQAFDTLVISAFPDDYQPTSRSLIGALHRKGVSVEELSRDKAKDMRKTHSCWMSKPLRSSEVSFEKIMCFEPQFRGSPPEVVGDIFRSLIVLENEGFEIKNVAMPLVATGDQKTPIQDMLLPLIEASFGWMKLGLEIDRLAIFVRSEQKAQEALSVFSSLKSQYQSPITNTSNGYRYDVFISYSHKNTEVADYIVQRLRELKPDINVFLDRQDLNTGMAWQKEIFEVLDDCRKVLVLFSPTYIASKVCTEEYHIALYRDRDSIETILFPIYIKRAHLPTYMKLTQYVDCRDINYDQINLACEQFIYELEHKSTEFINSKKDAIHTENNHDESLIEKLSEQLQENSSRISQLEDKIDQVIECLVGRQCSK